ncbi:NHLP family bacteriocin export ABC transporter peptidase/permease/ATPase subunit [Azospirillum sp. TSA2s]|uniref:NHLP family bacteriocin export ABC transporter peptidase/permease/ATPase subunit n=1 Tax=Azospirillum sp. TSA2s TaxID=709810 RepID=UPI0010AABEBD|nr:NHLP family bacteriocin export ABC transporter peptidase/permease/ATPase subunit [Azospirillum sp. TSA2s]QCG92490.1 NHLP family bacteriocin export ABC transporter peptidase/permease/ATPase subunit [Azospirillum sp. TSA2s]
MRTPSILQIEAAECGAAALGIVAAHYGRWLTLEDLRERCGISRDGSRAANLVQAARELGLQARGVRTEPEGLQGQAGPMILHWGMDHFLVLEGRRGRWWYLNDPARGRRRVDDAEFRRQFTGIALLMVPGPEFRKGGSAPSALRGLARRLRKSWGAVWFAAAISLLLAIPGMLFPAFRQIFMDSVLVGGLADWMTPLIGAMMLVGAVTLTFTWLQKSVLHRLETRLALLGGIGFMERVLRLPMGFFGQRGPAAVADRIMQSDRLAELLAGEIGGCLFAILTALTYLAAMAFYQPALALVAVAAAASLALALALLSRQLEEGQQRLLNESAQEGADAKQGLRMIETYRAAGAERLLFERLVARHARVLNIRQSLMLRRAVLRLLPAFVGGVASAAVVTVGGGIVAEGGMTIGAMMGFMVLMSAFLAPVSRLVQLGARIQEARSYLRLLDDTMQHPIAEEFRQAQPQQASAVLRRLTGRIELRDVTFGHSRRAPPLIRGLSLTIEPGERVGVVGGSGSGKSTLALLTAGLYEPWSGEVLLDGKPLREIPRRVLRQSVQVVDQNVTLFEGSVRDNIALWDPTVSDERLFAAARDAVIHDIIIDRRDGYASPVSEGGANLSGGQRARIEMARALVQNPRILVMDEATAALDDHTQAQLLSNLRRRGSTMLVIAHRLTAIRDCDRVLVMQSGEIVESGPPAELARRAGAFSSLMLSMA